MTTAGQTRAIHAMRKKGQMDNREYRGLLQARFGKASSADLTDNEAARLIDELRVVTGAAPSSGRAVGKTASGKYAPVLRALWISAWHLGLAKSRDDAALLAFVTRQTGLAHTRFLTDPGDARSAIEGLKAWIARDGGVDWPTEAQAKAAGREIGWLRKEAVARACVEKLAAAAAGDPSIPGATWGGTEATARLRGLPQTFDLYGEHHWDLLIAWLGGKIREGGSRQSAVGSRKRRAA